MSAAAPAAGRLLLWVASPRPAPDGDRNPGYDPDLTEAARLIRARVAALADAAVRHRPPRMLPLGQLPAAPDAERAWRRHVAVIAAYRDQHRVTTNDPRQVLGPCVEAGRAARQAYWHAAESVLAARRLAGLDPARPASFPDATARAGLAAGIYRALPEHQRAAISGEMAERLGDLWFGNRAAPDEDAATQPVHAATLTAALARRPRLTLSRPGRTRQRAPKPAPVPRFDPQPRPVPASPSVTPRPHP